MKIHRAICATLALGSLALSSRADWTIVAIDRNTGELAVAGASCFVDLNMREAVPVIVVGKGAAALDGLILGVAGSTVAPLDVTGQEKVSVFESLSSGKTPTRALNIIRNRETMVDQQVGIVAFSGGPASFTGGAVNEYFDTATGTVGSVDYVIQGNNLFAPGVITLVADVFENAAGDMGERVLAAMQTARDAGGDGRCMCLLFDPTLCDETGEDPPADGKSAHVAFMIVSRFGDTDGNCADGKGCAQGDYYLTLNVKKQQTFSEDPVNKLTDKYMTWRNKRVGSPDGVLSEITSSTNRLLADGFDSATVTIQLRDVDGVALQTGGTDVQVVPENGLTTVSPVTDNGDGTYTFTATGTSAGLESFVITAEDDVQKATLYPSLEMQVDAFSDMYVGVEELSASAGGTVPLIVNAFEGSAVAGASYFILASASGTSPGTVVGAATVPLNADGITTYTLLTGGDPTILPGTVGVLDANGRAEGAFLAPPPAVLSAIVGLHLDWATFYVDSTEHSTGVQGFDIVP